MPKRSISRTGKTYSRARGASSVSAALVYKICERVANGATLTAILTEPGMPTWSAFHRRIRPSCDLRAAYAQAREERAERMADELLQITDTPQLGEIVTVGPKGTEVKTADMIQHRTLQVDARKWLLSKLLPARFGDAVQHTGAGGGPIQHEHSLSPAMLANLATLRARLPSLPQPVTIDATPGKVSASAD